MDKIGTKMKTKQLQKIDLSSRINKDKRDQTRVLINNNHPMKNKGDNLKFLGMITEEMKK